jgi:hypothetical protein
VGRLAGDIVSCYSHIYTEYTYNKDITSAWGSTREDGLCDRSCYSGCFDCFGVGCAAERDG